MTEKNQCDNMEVSIGFAHVSAYIQSPEVSRDKKEELYNMLRVMLNKKVEHDSSDEDIVPLSAAAEKAIGNMTYEGPKVDLLAQLEGSNANSNNRSGGLEALKAKVGGASGFSKSVDNSVDIELPERCVKLRFVSADTYGDGYFEILDAGYKAIVDTASAKLAQIYAGKEYYFPYGIGQNKGQLKIKKTKYAKKGVEVELTVRFSPWTTKEGKFGYSCWAK
jgi:YHS domain-containing protein